MFAGHPQWVGEISARVGDLTEDPRLRAEASLLGGWALGVTLRHEEALALLLGVAEAGAASAPELALGTLSTAATSVYNSGAPFYRTELRRISALIDEAGNPAALAWSQAVIDPHHQRARLIQLLKNGLAAMSQESLADLTALGGATWILDETEEAVRILGGPWTSYGAPAARAPTQPSLRRSPSPCSRAVHGRRPRPRRTRRSGWRRRRAPTT
ncbi:hypothetical protein SAZ11_04020 [Streptomyces sp. FXJ1.4098]|nr:hypothetical protein [Streptomyces sp. FXJ1.4098]